MCYNTLHVTPKAISTQNAIHDRISITVSMQPPFFCC
jgi:hypothetical protein